MKKKKPSIVLLNETQLTGRMKCEVLPYGWSFKNRSSQGGGGVASGVAQQFRDFAVAAGEGVGSDEYIVTRIEKFQPAINIINCYGEQRKTKKEEVEEKWRRLQAEMETIRARGEFCLLAGDLNKLVGNDLLGVPGSHPQISIGGQLLRDLLATKNWVLVNSMGDEVVEGGPWTREDPATGEKSCLDLFIASRGLEVHINKLVIDSSRQMAVSRVVKAGGKYKRVFSDHYSCWLELQNLPLKRVKRTDKQVKWNLAKEGGWTKYWELTNLYSTAIEDVIENKNKTIQEKVNKVEQIHAKIKYQAFGKVTINKSKHDKTEYEKETTLEDEWKEQEKKTMIEVEKIENANTSKMGRIWNIRKEVLGLNKKQESCAIINPKTGKLAVTKKEILETTLKYCKETLENNDPEEDYKQLINEKKRKVKELIETKEGVFETDINTFHKNIQKFKRSRKKNYDFLTKSGDQFQRAMFLLLQQMLKEEVFPQQFKRTNLHMIYKGKGKKEELANNRFIHCKEWMARAAEGLVVQDGLKHCLLAGSSIYQVGGQPGHRPDELVYVLKSLVGKMRQEKRQVIIQCYDVQKFFDKEMIEDGVLTCLRRGAGVPAIRLWYKLNQDTRIRVKTAAGVTDWGDVGAVVGQGTIGGALVSQAVLDEGVMEKFPLAGSPVPKDGSSAPRAGRSEMLEYGSVPIAPLMWVDDMLNPAETIEQAKETNKKVNELIKERGLSLHKDKTTYLIIGSKKQVNETQQALKRDALKCGNFETIEKQDEAWCRAVSICRRAG